MFHREGEKTNPEEELSQLVTETCRDHDLHNMLAQVDNDRLQGWVGAVWHKQQDFDRSSLVRLANDSPLFPTRFMALRAMLHRAMDYVAKLN